MHSRPLEADPERLALAFAVDGGYAMPLATTLRSMAESNAAHWPVQVYVLAERFPIELRQRVTGSLPAGSVDIQWLTPDLSEFTGLSATSGASRVLPLISCARLLLPRLLPASRRRVLYLDADILVLRDLGELWRTDLQGLSLGAVLDGMDAVRLGASPAFANVPRVRRYFNSGVLLMDLARWRGLSLSEQAHRYLVDHPHSPYTDQDALNVACDGDWHPMPESWNFQTLYHPGPLGASPSARLPGIVHFVTGAKPWKAAALTPHAGFYDAFRSRTLFARGLQDRLDDIVSAAWALAKKTSKRLPLLGPVLRMAKARQSALHALEESRS